MFSSSFYPPLCSEIVAAASEESESLGKKEGAEFHVVCELLEHSSNRSIRPMGSFRKELDREFMKMAMMKHEEIFRNQVHELHRLYRVQKILMEAIKAEENNLELTLSIGNRRKDEVSAAAMDSETSFSPSSARFTVSKWEMFRIKNFQNERKSLFDVEEEVRAEGMMKQSPLLLQCLSLNIT